MEELTFQGQRLHAYRSTPEGTPFFIYSEVVDAFHLTPVSPTTLRRARGGRCGQKVPADVLVELKRVGLVQQKATGCVMLSEKDVEAMLDYLRDRGHLSAWPPTSSSTSSALPPPPTPTPSSSSSSPPASNVDETDLEGENREEGQVEERGEEGMPAPAEADLQPNTNGDSSQPPPPTDTPSAPPPAKKRRRRLTQYPDPQEVEDLDDFLKWLATPKTQQGRGLEKTTADKTGQKLLRE